MEKKNLKRAKFITFEGVEGSGKSSVINFLVRLLSKNGFSCKTFIDPGSTEIGNKIRKLLLDKNNKKISFYTELLLYLAARAQLIQEKLRKALFKYDFVICDRFFDSTLVYQGYAMNIKIAEKAVKMFSFNIVPDLTFLLDISPNEGLKRILKKDRIESRPIKFHQKLQQGYLKLAKKYPNRIKVIKADSRLEDICKQVEKILNKRFKIHLN